MRAAATSRAQGAHPVGGPTLGGHRDATGVVIGDDRRPSGMRQCVGGAVVGGVWVWVSGWWLGAVRVLWTRVMVWSLWLVGAVGVVGEVGVGRCGS